MPSYYDNHQAEKEKIWEKSKNSQKNVKIVYKSLCVCVCVGLFVCVDYMCILLCVVVLVIFSMCVYDDTCTAQQI